MSEWRYEPVVHEDHGGADIQHYIMYGERLVAETETDARMLVAAANLIYPDASS